ncbi:GNAT family N-acetyltransferase [Actinoalloteichus hymeniacidonis]|nr:GNAT family N-acetyltransferase [Actinoalloteichus hymeniacidonis]MBB5906230.1 ribosomal protein S18 acetylase RimI-like enzyme [Actinoalloteichus hymeniacidonis]
METTQPQHPPKMSIRAINLADAEVAQEILELQRAAYEVEAELIGFEKIPQRTETLEELQNSGESFLALFNEDGLAAAVSWTRPFDGTIDICRLVVAPTAFRRGYATALLDTLEAVERPRRTMITVAEANAPVHALLDGKGFSPTRTVEHVPGLRQVYLERRSAWLGSDSPILRMMMAAASREQPAPGTPPKRRRSAEGTTLDGQRYE